METIVLHEGEYVLTSNGGINFGEITALMLSIAEPVQALF